MKQQKHTPERTVNLVAYLAPELPSLSATFVTNEILALKKLGLTIVPYSIHRPASPAIGSETEQLVAETTIIYEQSLTKIFGLIFKRLLINPWNTIRGLAWLTGDVFKTGIVRREALKLIYQFYRSVWLAQDLISKQVEHLHIHFAHVPTQVGMYAAALAGVPFSFQTHANDIFERPLLIKEKIRRAKKAVSISYFNRTLMEEKGGDLNNVRIVRCGVDSRLTLKDRQNKNSDRPLVIGTLGRLVEKKGVDTLIEAGRLLKLSQTDFRVEIAGDGPLLNQLKDQVKSSNLADKIIFKGALPHPEALEWMQSLDVFVLAGKRDRNGDMDGIPVVLMEAMNFGIPVISTCLSGIPELVINRQTGLIGEPGDARELADNLLEIRNDPQLVDQLISGAKDRITSEFDIFLNARRLMDLFNS